jgi:hypothetical protein
MTSVKSNESKARRLARRLGLRLIKSRQMISMDNLGNFMLVDASRNFMVGRGRFEWMADDVIKYCRELEASEN